MELDQIVQPLLALLGSLGPWGALAAAAIVFFLRRKGWLRIPGVEPKPVDPNADPLADHPLLKRLRDRLRVRFGELLEEGFDEDDVYALLSDQVRWADFDDGEDEDEDDGK